MRSTRYCKLFLYTTLSILILFVSPAMAQDVSSAQDTVETWKEDTAVSISFGGDTVDISGEGAAFSNGTLTIDRAGTYVLAGKWNSGQIRIDAGKEDTVHLILNGASIRCPDSAPLYASQAGKVIITLVKDTVNALSDGSTYTYKDGEAELESALYVQDSLTINGRGSLSVTASFKHGILSKDDLLIENGVITVTAADVGIRGRDTLTITGGEITVDSKGDAMQSNNSENPEKGLIKLTGGKFNLTSMKDGIQAESGLIITGGDFTLHTGGITTAQDQVIPEDWLKSDSSADAPGKGLKAGSDINITGGTFKLFCSDDAVNANGKITIQDGIFDIAARDDGLRANKNVEISGGKLNFLTCSDGINTAGILISGGSVYVNALDDGFHSAAGSNGDSSSGAKDQAGSAIVTRLTGGDVTIKALGDCIDSSGSVFLEGGTLSVNGSVGDTSDAVDFTDSFLVKGGSLAASGCKGLVKEPGSDSEQPSLMITFSTPVAAGRKVDLADENGTAILTCTPSQDYQVLLFSSPDMAVGKSYSLKVNGEEILTAELTGTVTCITQDESSKKD